ncbi:MAG: homocysteine S-methyltransferase family protein [Candidatus Gracilibacteria bacterium]|nr:homocysteine S-methyltransferase family protein [Candidatus Gracilibacteria bacterium]
MKPLTLFGPYGTRLEQKAAKHHFSYGDPTDILGSAAVARAVGDIADEYLNAGARAITIPCFGARWSLHKHDGLKEYNKLTERNFQIVLERLNNRSDITRDKVRILFCVGPKNDCYDPKDAPSIQESAEFHEKQIRQIDALTRKYQTPVTALFETLPSGEEAEGIAIALKKFHKGVTNAILSYPFNYSGSPLGEETFLDIIKRVDAHQNGLMISHGLNCGPIEGVAKVLNQLGDKKKRVSIIYPNASSKPHAELNNVGVNHGVINSQETTAYLRYLSALAELAVIGGCCGYDESNISDLSQNNEVQVHTPPTDRLAAR